MNLGNGVYQPRGSRGAWARRRRRSLRSSGRSATVSPDTIRTKGEAIRSALAAAKQVTLSSARMAPTYRSV